MPKAPPAAGRVAKVHRPHVTTPGKSTAAVAANLALLFTGIVFLIPLVWLVPPEFNPAATRALQSPRHPSLANFKAVLNGPTTFTPMLNSLLLSGLGAIIVMVLAVLAAYPLSRYKLRFGNSFIYVILFGASLPITAIMVPVYALFVGLGLIDSYIGVILF